MFRKLLKRALVLPNFYRNSLNRIVNPVKLIQMTDFRNFSSKMNLLIANCGNAMKNTSIFVLRIASCESKYSFYRASLSHY